MYRWATALVGLIAAASLGACGEVQPTVVQLRWCVILGTEETDGADAQTLLNTYRKDGDALAKANEIWAPAHILFVSVVAERNGIKGVPVIRDPDTDLTQGELAGDIDAGFLSLEPLNAALECQRRWKGLDESLEGPIVVTVRRYFNVGFAEAFGVSSSPNSELFVGGEREDDLCSDPRNLDPEDVFEMGTRADHDDVGFATVAEPRQFFNPNHHGRVLAHELGHVLTLGHGNGLDDNADGVTAGTLGPRLFDEYCDPLGKEEDPTSDQVCTSLMEDGAPCSPLTALQIEQARAAALPGCSGLCD